MMLSAVTRFPSVSIVLRWIVASNVIPYIEDLQ